ncbi:MAG: DDE-type integrase/transposase/recombinase [Chloroflexales bacterium]|nr:DDE-type integrase/transposase/recombinase [Chloroflexales bacterium]
MPQLGLQAVTVRNHPATSAPGHRVYPYLLRDLAITAPDQVWCADIRYVPLPRGFLDLVAMMDWFRRYVVVWELANSLEGSCCCTALERALQQATPTICNTDQGAQFTAQRFTQRRGAGGSAN